MNIIQKAMTTVAMGAMVSVALGGPGGLDPAHARNKSGKLEPPPADKAKPQTGDAVARNKTVWWIPTAAAVAIAVIVLASGNDRPTSP
jgi:hypothetical protein